MIPSLKSLKKELHRQLKGASSLVILGVGSELRADDIAGLAVAQALKPLAKTSRKPKITVILGGTAPENFTGEIKALNPSHLLILDSAQMGLKPGTLKILTLTDSAGVCFSTHALPLSVMLDYIKASLPDLQCIIIGIQPQILEVNAPASPEVLAAVEKLSKNITTLIKKL
jgi:hydrogenase 3 maturation protease